MTPTRLFVQQIAKARDAIGFKERDICELAGVKSRTQIGRSRSGESPMNWDYVSSICDVLWREYRIRREWLLYAEGKMLPDGEIVRIGAGAHDINPKAVGARKRSGNPDSSSYPPPRAGKHGRGA